MSPRNVATPAGEDGRRELERSNLGPNGSGAASAIQPAMLAFDVTGISAVADEPERPGTPEDLPSERELAAQTNALLTSHRGGYFRRLKKRYGLLVETVRDFELGLEQRQDGPWVTIPVRAEDGTLVNVRRRYVGNKERLNATGQKYRNLTGRGEARLYLADRLPEPGAPLLVCCGEFDALVFRQATGLAAVSPTAGCLKWPAGWEDLGARYDVTVTYDRGEEPLAEGLARRLGVRVRHLDPSLPRGTDIAALYRAGGRAALEGLLPPAGRTT